MEGVMSRSIAAAGRYKFGECGYIVDGVYLQDGTKLKNMRIYRQRSHRLYDILDPKTNVIYRKVQLTTTDTTGYQLNYNKTNDQLLSEIKKNSFFIRGHTEQNLSTDPNGFVYKFLLHKTILGSSTTLYDMYVPECGIVDHDIDNIIMFPVFVGDDLVGGRLFNAGEVIDTTGMKITVILPDGTEYFTTEIIDDVFSIPVDAITQQGKGTVILTSDIYNTKTVEFDVLESGEDIGFVTNIALSQFDFVSDGLYKAVLPEVVHDRGDHLVLQAYNANDFLIGVDINVDASGNITVYQSDNEPISLSVIGKTIQTTPYFDEILSSDWVVDSEMMYTLSVPKATHGKLYPQVQVYDDMNHTVLCEIELDADDNVTVRSVEPFDSSIVIVGYTA